MGAAAWTYEFQLEGIRSLRSFRGKQADLLRCSAGQLLLELGHEVLRKQRRSSMSENDLDAAVELLPSAIQCMAQRIAHRSGHGVVHVIESLQLDSLVAKVLCDIVALRGEQGAKECNVSQVWTHSALPSLGQVVAAGRRSHGGRPI